MENITYTELIKQRKFHQQKIVDLNDKIAEYQTKRLAQKRQSRKAELQAVNKDYINTFAGDPYLIRLLFTRIDDYSFWFPYGLKTRLRKLHLFYVWQVVIRPEEYFQQEDVLDSFFTGSLKKQLAEKGLYLGMKLGHI